MTLYPNALFKSFDLDDNSLGNKLIPFELQESSKSIQIEAFHVFKVWFLYLKEVKRNDRQQWWLFKCRSNWLYSEIIIIVAQLFVANQNKPAEIVNILVTNRSKLLRLLADLRPDKGIKSPVLSLILFLLANALFGPSCFVCRGWEVWSRQKSGLERNFIPWAASSCMNQPTDIVLPFLFKHSKDIFGGSKFVLLGKPISFTFSYTHTHTYRQDIYLIYVITCTLFTVDEIKWLCL